MFMSQLGRRKSNFFTFQLDSYEENEEKRWMLSEAFLSRSLFLCFSHANNFWLQKKPRRKTLIHFKTGRCEPSQRFSSISHRHYRAGKNLSCTVARSTGNSIFASLSSLSAYKWKPNELKWIKESIELRIDGRKKRNLHLRRKRRWVCIEKCDESLSQLLSSSFYFIWLYQTASFWFSFFLCTCVVRLCDGQTYIHLEWKPALFTRKRKEKLFFPRQKVRKRERESEKAIKSCAQKENRLSINYSDWGRGKIEECSRSVISLKWVIFGQLKPPAILCFAFFIFSA